MLFSSILTVVFASLARTTLAQDQFGNIVYDAIHNATAITGTWSSGSKAVRTGQGFANPANMTFNYPKTTGISYSFTDDGFYEISRYRFNSNGSEPTCITGVIAWSHGKYTLNANGSISMSPFEDGFQQVQDPCAAISNFIEPFTTPEYYKGWRIFMDASQGPKLHMFQFDGTPLAPMFQVSVTPNMLPTQLLRNTDEPVIQRRSSAQGTSGSQWKAGVVAGAGLALISSTISML
ncbi:Protein rot1 [Psilocybe cubensis]|uniref:Protein ROT1 n=2 Tax=Psilocybe cubensis TaxID=181762 RepID=A0A8H8CHJ0_PSICU|nr:Protein rot1 [Psilocybe cubensis]KAH9480663.1 Protein rot1 [Psilocybe cubensis]